MRHWILIAFIAQAALSCTAQSIERKLIEQADLDSTELVTLTGLDSLSCCLAFSPASVDTTVILSDSLAMSMLFIGDKDGVCTVRYLLIWRPTGSGSRGLLELYPDCDGGAGEEEYFFNKFKILADHSIVIVEVASREYDLDGVVQTAPLRIVSWRLVQVLKDGSVEDTGDVDPKEWMGPVFTVEEIEDWGY